jgi:uncharacterized protein
MTDPTIPAFPAPQERIQAMDVLRGFALLGILLMNIEALVGPLNGALTGVDPALTGADRAADTLVYLFVQGKFYPLFSLLFGMGFAVMLARAESAERPFFMTYLCRVLALLVIGLAHALLVWPGDILVSYALVAVVLLLFFRRTPTSRLPKWGIAFILLPSVVIWGLGALVSVVQMVPEAASQMDAQVAEQREQMAAVLEAQRQAYGSGSFAEATAQRLADLKMMMGFLVFWGPQLLGLFLLGAWFVRSGAIARPHEHARFYRRLRLVALPVGLAMVVVSYLMAPTSDMVTMNLKTATAMGLFTLGGTLMALGYLAWIVAGVGSVRWGPLLGHLAPAGRMALSNYLLQSLVCTAIFYGYGLGYFEQLPRAWQVPFVLGLFLGQVALSRAWLSVFRMGPMEWLWRTATYLRLPPMRA